MRTAVCSESWAVFEQDKTKDDKEKSVTPTNLKQIQKDTPLDKESPYSSDGKNEYKQREKEYHRRWPKPHTSSSSRDVSPWDEDAPPPSSDYRRRTRQEPYHHPPSDRYVRPNGPMRRKINSCDDEYDEEYERRGPLNRRVPLKSAMHRSKEFLDSENPNWCYHSENWSDEDEIERMRNFDRNAYERSTYGPPYDKRDPKNFSFDRRDYKSYDKRTKYFRQNRNDYEYDPYDGPPPLRGKSRKDFDDHEASFERGSRESRSAREYFYDRERKSFDSNESFESGRGHRMGSGEISGSYEGSRGDYRDRYNRSFRRNQRPRGGPEDDDTDEETPVRRPHGEVLTGSLQRSVLNTRSKHIQLDDDVWGSGTGGKHWKRPSSASAGVSGSIVLSGSDGEKDKRHRRKGKSLKSKEIELRSNYGTIRYSHQPQHKEFYEFDDERLDNADEPSPTNDSPRLQDCEPAGYYGRKKTSSVRSLRVDSKSSSEYSKPSRYPEEDEYEQHRSKGQVFKKSSIRDLYENDPKDYYGSSKVASSGYGEEETHTKKLPSLRKMDFGSEEQPHSLSQTLSKGRFNFEGFESDFNSSPKNAEQKPKDQQNFTFETEFSPSTNMPKNGSNQQKLRFNENVSISKFDANSSAQQMFEDDFLEWTPETHTAGNIQSSLKKISSSNLKTNSVFNRHDNIKKSDSVNIFARKSDEDPFENDDFFIDDDKVQPNNKQDPFHWSNKNNFANFEDNKNI
jgi:disabled homolog 2